MKKVLVLFSLFVLSSFLLSCNKDKDGNEVITVDGKAAVVMTMDKAGDSKTVIVRGNEPWTIEAIEWVSVSPTSGPAGQDVTVTISVEANTGEERSGGVAFILPGTEFAEAIIIQPGGSN